MKKRSDPYLRPLVQMGPGQPEDALTLAGGCGWFRDVEILRRDAEPTTLPARDLSETQLAPFLRRRTAIAGLAMDVPRVMGILNATPDSFSDGGVHGSTATAIAGGQAMVQAGADIIDIGGESTRPGAEVVDAEAEAARVVPVISGLRAAGVTTPISIDTRKADVARAALASGAGLINDVSGFTYDAELAPVAAQADVPVCVMHGPFDPATMQGDPSYDDVVLDVFDFLTQQIAVLEAAGVARDRIVADPGIGFGKTMAHNLALLARLSVFHGLGVPILLGASRKKFIGTISGVAAARDRMSGSIAVALAGIAQGVQIVRVHDVPETVQAIALMRASVGVSDHE